MNTLFDAEELRAAHRGQLSLDLAGAADQVPAEPQLDERQADELSVIPNTHEVEVVESAHSNPATCGARGYRRLTCRSCWPRPDRCGWGTCTRHALFDVTDPGGDEMPACLRCAQLAVVAGCRVVGRGRG